MEDFKLSFLLNMLIAVGVSVFVFFLLYSMTQFFEFSFVVASISFVVYAFVLLVLCTKDDSFQVTMDRSMKRRVEKKKRIIGKVMAISIVITIIATIFFVLFASLFFFIIILGLWFFTACVVQYFFSLLSLVSPTKKKEIEFKVKSEQNLLSWEED